ncbi:AEC family transporter [Litorivicinus sp.]|nr:AEC family transporter [Litorivicinus sp.]
MIGLISNAVLPIAVALLLGFLLKRFGGRDESFWRGLEWLSYWVLMPSLLISVIISAPAIDVPWLQVLFSLFGTLICLTLLLFIGWKTHVFGREYARFTSLYQGVIRFNTFISLAVMSGLRPDLLPHLGIAAACIIVVINIACVSVMTMNSTDHMVLSVSRELARNPLILACLLGGLGRITGVPNGFPISGLDLIGQAALPMGVLCLGAGLQWGAIRTGLGLTTCSVVLQLAVKPILFSLLAIVIELSSDWALVGLLLMSVSTAPSSYILARQLGGDAQLMAGIVATQTIFAIGSLPVVLFLADFIKVVSLS